MLLEQNAALPIADYIQQIGYQAKEAASKAATLTGRQKNSYLELLIERLLSAKDTILTENKKDVTLAKNKKINAALIERLIFTEDRFQDMITSIRSIIGLPDPIGEMANITTRPSGIRVGKLRVPIGVVVMIYESRPNVTIDTAILNIKVGNAVILRGGSEAFYTNMALYQQLSSALSDLNMPECMVQIVAKTDRVAVSHLVSMDKYVDLVIPRGGKSLITKVAKEATVNVLKHLDGNCHVYVDSGASIEMANSIAWNAKTRRYGVCNAMESLLVAKDIAEDLLPSLLLRYADHGISLRLCSQTMKLAKSIDSAKLATEDDWYTEYLGPILSVKIVDGLNLAIDHINTYGSHHTDAIVTNNYAHAEQFLNQVDSSSVIVNASTAFADGYEYGLGAEIGISTDKFHARGPVGLEGLTTQKYIVLGHGEIRP